VMRALSQAPSPPPESSTNAVAARALLEYTVKGQSILNLRHCVEQPWVGEELLCETAGASLFTLATSSRDRQRAPGLCGLCVCRGRIDEGLTGLGVFDHALVQAPCSLDGAFARDPSLWGKWKASRAALLAPLQRLYLLEALRRTREGGVVVYAVASLNPHEGSAIVSSAAVAALASVEEAQTQLPHRGGGCAVHEGCFVAVLRRTASCDVAWPAAHELASGWDVLAKLGGGKPVPTARGDTLGVSRSDTEAFVRWALPPNGAATDGLVVLAGEHVALAVTEAVAAWGEPHVGSGRVLARRTGAGDPWVLEADAFLLDRLRCVRAVKLASDAMRALQAGETVAASCDQPDGSVLAWSAARLSKAERKRAGKGAAALAGAVVVESAVQSRGELKLVTM